MDHDDLLKLLTVRDLTPAELRERHPDLWKKLEEPLREAARQRFLETIGPDREAARKRVEQVDLRRVPPQAVGQRLQDVAAGLPDREPRAEQLARKPAAGPPLDVPLVDDALPIGRNPGIDRLVRKGKLLEIGRIGKLDPKLLDRIAEDAGRPESISDAVLTKLVAARKVTEAQAAELGAAATIYALADESPELAQAIRSMLGRSVHGTDWTRTLAAYSAEDWLGNLRKARVPIPEGTTDEALAAAIERRFAALHPDLALLAHLPQVDVRQVTRTARDLEVVLRQYPDAFGRKFSDLDLSELPPGQQRKAAAAHAALLPIVRAYPGLGLGTVLRDPDLDAAAKAETLAHRTSLVAKLHERLGDGELFHLDLSPDSPDLDRLGLDGLGATEEQRRLVLATFKAYQRIYLLAGKVEDARALMADGYSSAAAVAVEPLAVFSKKSTSPQAEKTWRAARTALVDSTLIAGSVLDTVYGLFGDLAFGNVLPGAEDYLRKLDGFESLFGSLSFCTCQHCQSILSPAAYLVDLLYFVEQHIRPQLGSRTGHPLDLQVRRPDLWTLELTCENTEQRIPTLDIVNEILESYIAEKRGFAGSLSDRDAVEDLVYRQTLRDTVDSFQQPFHLPLARVDRYLEKVETTRADVARTVGADPQTVAAAELGLSPEQWQLVTHQELGRGRLEHLYQLTFVPQGGGFAPHDAQQLVAAMGLDRVQLDDLIATAFVRASGADVEVKAEKRSADSVQNDIEKVHGLTAGALDRMHRFTRLWRHTPWSIPELDRLLSALGEATLDEDIAGRVAAARTVQRRLDTAVDETAGLAGELPRTPEGGSLFDRLFNPPDTPVAERFPLDARRFVHPAFRSETAVPPDPALPRLVAGLGVDLTGLESLLRGLAPHLEAAGGTLDPEAPDEDDRDFLLTAANLTLLYRHARLAHLLRMTVDELLGSIRIAGIGGGRLANEGDVLALTELATWRRASGYSMDDLAVATGAPPRDEARYVDPAAAAETIVADAAGALSFGDTVFSVALGTTEAASRELLEANPGVVERTADDRWRLVAGLDLAAAPIALPASATVPVPPDGSRAVTEEEVRGSLAPYEPSAVLVRALGTALGFDAAKVEALAGLAGVSLHAEVLDLALRGEAAIDPLRDAIATLVPLAVAFEENEWDAAAIDFVAAHPARFDLAPPAPTLESLRAISVYTTLAKRKVGTGAEAAPVDPADIRAALAAFDAGVPGFPTSANEVLGRILDVSPGLIAALRGRIAVPAVAAPALGAVERAAATASALGIDGESLAALAGSDYRALDRGADALRSAFGARFPSGDERATQLDLLAEPLRESKRDGLVAWLVHSHDPRIFLAPDDLYQYFLIDAESGGCATTSRVVAAISSVQLYIHRILLNLEQTSPDVADPLALTLPEEAAAEWTWRKNYRVWEANRKVFLWPENYIEPDLRDNKTPLFRELESELLQTSLTDQDVLDAYTKYLKGFEELSRLTIAGVYHDVREEEGETTDVFHLLGAASTDPPVYYYRSCENLAAGGRDANKTAVWTPWRKIEVQITGRRAAPVVYRGRLHIFWADFKTRSFNRVEGGSSTFAGYRHTMSIRYTTLRPDGSWSAPQLLALPVDEPGANGRYWRFGPSRGVIEDAKADGGVRLDPDRAHPEPLDDYTLGGVNWEALYLDPYDDEFTPLLNIVGRNYQLYAYVDLFRNSVEAPHPRRDLPGDELGVPVLCAKGSWSTRSLWYGYPYYWYPNRNAYGDLVLDERRIETFNAEINTEPLREGLYVQKLATIGEVGLLSVAGSIEDAVLQSDADVLLLQGSVTEGDSWVLRRIGTTLADEVAYRLFAGGVDGLLDIETQMALREADIPITDLNRIDDRSNAGTLDFTGPYGVYYREIFFHIPFLIADALNGRGSFAAAQRWYHYLFDPTASEVIEVPAGTPPEERARRLLDRVWRYREFRGLDPARLRDILTDDEALAVYRRDPFNPHAIARLRLSAYQKSIVMKYVDNLLDWADFLFTQFTMESINEALMLYIMASDILGPRPARLGDCGEGKVAPKTYENIRDEIGAGEEILIEIESWLVGRRVKKKAPPQTGRFALDRSRVARVRAAAPLPLRSASTAVRARGPALRRENIAVAPLAVQPLASAVVGNRATEATAIFRGLAWKETRTGGWSAPLAASTTAARSRTLAPVGDHRVRLRAPEWIGTFGWSIVRQVSPVFCVPVNRDLIDYWDRVEDRLYKIRHCMDITGARRELALFAPPIEPGLLVRMRAAGLTLEDVLGGTSGDLPPYRFLYLIDRAKAFAATLGSFGAALLSALEKKDSEELGRLRLVHQQNLTRMTTQLRRWEIETAEEALAQVQRQKEAAEYRRDYFAGLASEYRSGLEMAESVLRHTVSGIQAINATLETVAGVGALLPQTGSPFAMKWGGVELNTSLHRYGTAAKAVAEGLQAIASSIGLEANFERRAQGWTHQKKLAEHEIRQLDKQIEAAEIRLEIADRALEIHEKSIEQMDEVLELTDGKLSSFGFYTWLSTQLRRVHRAGYQNALALARLAEQAFRFERGDQTSPGLEPTYWDATHSGLLAGEQLLIDLQSLERRYLETNYRNLEVDQTFALSQIAPDALIALREEGECTFEIGELFFDLFYPGQYKRRIRAVRLTIPSITGPYVNVSATLTLDRSWIRTTPSPGAALTEMPPRRSVSVATSTAQNDAGVFELSFRDERYMPFEGAGAISRWRLALPKTFRQFDYQTINDVIVSISYTAEQDGALRERVETDNAALEGSLREALAGRSLGRVFSLRQDFSAAFNRLLHSPASTAARIEITHRHFPLFLGQRPLAVSRSVLLLRTADGVAAGAFELGVDGAAVSGFVDDPTLGGLPAHTLPAAFAGTVIGEHVLTVENPGDLAPPAPPPGDASALDADRLLDLLLYLEYTVA